MADDQEATVERHKTTGWNYCLAARMGGPDHPPFLCYRAKGHRGPHAVFLDGKEFFWTVGQGDADAEG